MVVAAPAAGYVRTEDPGTRVELAWPFPVVTYRVNTAPPDASSPSCAATQQSDPALDATRAGFSQWEQSCTNLQLVYGGPTDEIRIGSDGTEDNVVVFREGWCSERPEVVEHPCYADSDVDCGGIFNCFEDHTTCPDPPCADRGVVALTSVLYDPRNGRIMNADIEMNGWDGFGAGSLLNTQDQGWYFTCGDTTRTFCTSYGQAGCDFIDLQNTITHEVGHFIGLAHAPQQSATMYAQTEPGDVEKRDLSADDIAGVCDIYPESDDGGGCGCGSGGGATAVSLLLGALALRPRRRARSRVVPGAGGVDP